MYVPTKYIAVKSSVLTSDGVVKTRKGQQEIHPHIKGTHRDHSVDAHERIRLLTAGPKLL